MFLGQTKIDPMHTFDQILLSILMQSQAGLAAGLKPTDFVFHFNPTGAATDITATLFYKGFIRNGKVLEFGKSQH